MLASFECRLETTTREAFQREGHFVPGNVTGPVVYALSLFYPGSAKGTGQILRVLGNSEDECVGLMSEAVRKELFTQWHANQMVVFDRQAFQAMHLNLTRLAEYLFSTYPDIQEGAYPGLGPCGVAIRKLEGERRRWWHALGFKRAARTQPPDMMGLSDTNLGQPPDQGATRGQ